MSSSLNKALRDFPTPEHTEQKQTTDTDTTQSSKTVPLTLSRGCWELTIHVVDLEAGQVLGCAGLGGGEQRRVVDGEVAVVVLQDGQGCPLNAAEEKN